MNKKISRTSIALLCIVGLLGVALGYTLLLYTVNNQMRIVTQKEIQVEYPLTTKITSFDWGDFNKSDNVKTEVFYLRTFGNVPINITWQTSGLDPAFTFDLNVTMFEFSTYNETIPFEGTLTLVDFSHAPDTFSFDLEFGE